MNTKSIFSYLYGLVLAVLSLQSFSSELNCQQSATLLCGKTPSSIFDSSGRLWVVFAQQGHIYITHSEDIGVSFSKAVTVNNFPEPIYSHGENRPKLRIGKNHEIYISWTKKTSAKYSGDIRFSRSVDGGKTFSSPATVNDDGLETSHRFDSLHIAESGHLYLTWLDKRDQLAVRKSGGNYNGAALYYVVSSDSGKSFSKNFKVADNSCECCRIATANHNGDGIAVFWRHIFNDTTRDHGFALLGPSGNSVHSRATRGEWKIEACPHHGPDMAIANNDSYHITWFSNGSKLKGIYYGVYKPGAATATQLKSVDSSAGAGHPQVEAIGESVYLLWKAFDGEKTSLKQIHSSNGGLSWETAKPILSTNSGSDHPQLVRSGNKLYAAWHTTDEGYQIVAVN